MDIQKLRLGALQEIPPKAGEKPGRRFRQPIIYGDNKLALTLVPMKLSSLTIRSGDFEAKSLQIPVDGWLRNQLDTLDEFARNNIEMPECYKSPKDIYLKTKSESESPYKAFFPGSILFVTISNWCKLRISDKEYNLLRSLSEIGEGMYTITIDVPYIYFGPHSWGHKCSITSHVSKITYEPSLPDIDAILNSIVASETPESPPLPAKKKPKRLNKKVNNVSS